MRPRPEETLTVQARAGDWYSIVICDLQDLITVPAVQVKLFLEDEENGGYQKTERGNYLTKYATEEDYIKEIALRPVSSFSTPLEIYNELNRDSKEAVTRTPLLFF